MTYRAINDSVIVEVPEVQRETQRESGLFVLENKDESNKSTARAVVVSVGEGRFDTKTGTFIPPPVKVGDVILMSLATGVALDKTHRMIRIDDIFAVVE